MDERYLATVKFKLREGKEVLAKLNEIGSKFPTRKKEFCRVKEYTESSIRQDQSIIAMIENQMNSCNPEYEPCIFLKENNSKTVGGTLNGNF